jgi:hypothetical protein
MEWTQVYNGHSDLVLPTGVVATLLHTRGTKPSIKLVQLSAAPGSPKLDIALSLDIMATRGQYEFVERMKEESLVLLQRLEEWVEKQGTGGQHCIECGVSPSLGQHLEEGCQHTVWTLLPVLCLAIGSGPAHCR